MKNFLFSMMLVCGSLLISGCDIDGPVEYSVKGGCTTLPTNLNIAVVIGDVVQGYLSPYKAQGDAFMSKIPTCTGGWTVKARFLGQTYPQGYLNTIRVNSNGQLDVNGHCELEFFQQTCDPFTGGSLFMGMLHDR